MQRTIGGGKIISRKALFWTLALTSSLSFLVSGGVALWNFAILADEHGISEGATPFNVLLGIGLVGLAFSLPAFLATRNGNKAPKN
ncbi:hypothetical protein V1638_14960 [Pseudarthrobacter sp. J64]|uniref:hypothetical protein n=1 Tax=Pseudarthrobacter sp. J64 TaxID=3116485 RepID=UPI002E7FCCAD|nr:hypothetical protein [Pseudarthrobacter sp. J64]MEE2570684.1 hypothetical protein [Pseudarthrobacter sp. J64]